jgi:hypothetical protein
MRIMTTKGLLDKYGFTRYLNELRKGTKAIRNGKNISSNPNSLMELSITEKGGILFGMKKKWGYFSQIEKNIKTNHNEYQAI